MKSKLRRKKETHAQPRSVVSLKAIVGVLVLVTCIAFFPVLQASFNNFDDYRLITDNSIVNGKGESFGFLTQFIYSPHYKPLVFLSWKLEYSIAGDAPFLYHFNNLLLHVLNSILVFFIALKILPKFGLSKQNVNLTAGAIALLFSLHPLHVESVAWATERKDVLYGFFYLLSLLLYISYLRLKSGGGFWLLCGSAILYLCSGLSKGMGITLIAVLFLMDWLFKKKWGLRRIAEKAGHVFVFILLSFLYGFLTDFSGKAPGLVLDPSIEVQQWLPQSLEALPPAISGLMIAFVRMTLWLVHILIPVKLSLIYPRNDILQLLGFVIYLFPVLIGIISWLAFKRRNSSPVLLWGFAWFVIVLIPALGTDHRITSSFIADRYTYMALLGIVFPGVVIWHEFMFHKNRRLFYTIIGLVCILFAGMSFVQSTYWSSSVTLWTRAIEVCPDCTDAWLNRGVAYAFEEEDYQRAVDDYNVALKINPDHRLSLINRAKVLTLMGDYQNALNDLELAISSGGKMGEVYSLKAGVFLQMGNQSNALQWYNQAQREGFKSFSLFNNRGTIYYSRAEYQRALEDYLDAYELNPDDGKLMMNIALCYHAMGDLNKAKRFHQRALLSGEVFSPEIINLY